MTENQTSYEQSGPTKSEVDTYIDYRNNPVKFMIGKLNEIGTTYGIDSAGVPCFRFRNDPDRKLHPIATDLGKPTVRFRSHVRSQYSYFTKQEVLLSDISLMFITDHCMEEAFKGGRERVNTKAEDQGDYNFEALVVFAQMLQPDKGGAAHDLLRLVADEPKCRRW